MSWRRETLVCSLTYYCTLCCASEKNAGVHLTYFTSVDNIVSKLTGFAHSSEFQELHRSRDWVRSCVREGKHILTQNKFAATPRGQQLSFLLGATAEAVGHDGADMLPVGDAGLSEPLAVVAPSVLAPELHELYLTLVSLLVDGGAVVDESTLLRWLLVPPQEW
jgi:hypothetical protein